MVLMDLETYNSIYEEFKRLRKNTRALYLQDVIDQLIFRYLAEGIPEQVIRGLISYIHQCETKLKVGRIDWAKAYDDFKQGKGTIVSISADLDVSPTIVAKKFLLNITDKAKVKLWLQDTSMIPDGQLATDVMIAQYCDPIFGQLSHCAMTNAGELFESEVASTLKRAKVCYSTENCLRTKEFDVTPDFKLNIPLAIAVSPDSKRAYILPPISLPLCQLCSTDDKNDPQRLIVCWIECKALFASPQCHKDYLKYQLNSYANRFGRGLVLYKYGFVKSILNKNPQLTIVQELIYHECDDPMKLLTLQSPEKLIFSSIEDKSSELKDQTKLEKTT